MKSAFFCFSVAFQEQSLADLVIGLMKTKCKQGEGTGENELEERKEGLNELNCAPSCLGLVYCIRASVSAAMACCMLVSCRTVVARRHFTSLWWHVFVARVYSFFWRAYSLLPACLCCTFLTLVRPYSRGKSISWLFLRLCCWSLFANFINSNSVPFSFDTMYCCLGLCVAVRVCEISFYIFVRGMRGRDVSTVLVTTSRCCPFVMCC